MYMYMYMYINSTCTCILINTVLEITCMSGNWPFAKYVAALNVSKITTVILK